MKTKRFVLILAVVSLLAAGCKQIKIEGDGQVQTRQFAAGDFREIRLYGYNLEFDYTQAPDSAPALEITLDENLFDMLEIEATGNTLLIRPKNPYQVPAPTRFRVRARSRSLSELKKAGSGTFRVVSPLTTERLSVSAAGSGEIVLADTATVDVLKTDLTGRNFFQAWRLGCEDLTGKSSGENVFFLGGRVKKAAFKSAGDGTVKAPLCRFSTLLCKSAGKMEIEARVSEKMEIKSAGYLKVQYWGTPEIYKKTAGTNRFVRMGD